MTTVDAGLFPAERASWETLDGPAVAERGDANAGRRTRGWLVRRMLLAADVAGLTFAFLLALRLAGGSDVRIQLLVLVLALPVWVVAAKLAGLYGRDEERTDHSTLDEAVTVFALVTVGAWLGFLGLDAFGHPRLAELADFWAFAVAAVALGRTVARLISRRSVHYLQNAVIVGGGEVGQLVARKFRLHPEYGVRVVGFVDEAPRERRGDLVGLPLLGAPLHLRRIVQTFDVERVVVAFSRAADEETIAVVRSVRDLDVQVDVVPRLFDLVGPRADLHTVEGLTMLGLPPVELTPSSLLLKVGLPTVSMTNKRTLTVLGQTEPGARVEVAGHVVQTDATGRFSTQLKLDEGKNGVDVKAMSVGGIEQLSKHSVELDTQVRRVQVSPDWGVPKK